MTDRNEPGSLRVASRRRNDSILLNALFVAVTAGLLPGCSTARVADRAADVAPAPALRTGTHEAVIGNVRHWYRVAGQCDARSTPVVFLHGGPGEGSERFATFAGPRLEDSLCMVYFDQRGSGRSGRAIDGDYRIPTLVADIDGLRRTLNAPAIAIVAHSFGVLLALEYAAAHPEHVTRMVLGGGVWDVPAALEAQCDRLKVVNPEAWDRAAAAAAGSDRSCDLFRALSGPELEAFFESNMFPDPRTLTLLDSVDAASGYQNTGEMGRALFAGGLLDYRFTALETLRMPVLVIAGLLDHQGGTLHRDLVRRLPNARLLEYEGTGHFMYIEQPERFARDVVGFLRTPDAGAEAGPRDGADASVESVLWRAATNHWRVRVVDASAHTTTGTLQHASGVYRMGGVVIEPGRIVAIEREVDRGNGFLPGAVLGGIIMFAAGTDLPRTDGILEGGALGVIGALIGGWIGHAASPGRKEWVSVWP